MRAFVGIGANLGDPVATVGAAIEALRSLPRTRLAACSSLYGSSPVDAEGDDYVNAVAELDTPLPPLELLDALQGIEQAHGRVRPYRNAPRTLDLDLLLYGQRRMHDERLVLPHPRMHLRAFVLRPLTELDAALVIPGVGTLVDCLSHVADQRVWRLPAR